MKNKIIINILKVVVAVVSALALFVVFAVGALNLAFSTVDNGVYVFVMFLLLILVETTIIGLLWRQIKKKYFYIPLIVCYAITITIGAGYYGYRAYQDNIPTVAEREDMLALYAPYGVDSKVAILDDESSLKITDNVPVMDGATALFPIYSAFARAVYPVDLISDVSYSKMPSYKGVLKCTTTTQAYRNIVTGDADIIFAAKPSKEQEYFAEDNGVELTYTPIGKEAFVFFINAKNPIDNLSLDEIRRIYSGEISDWSELGVKSLGEIVAFQRDEGSGSQSTMERLMGKESLAEAPSERVIADMGGIIQKTADYKNYKNAIGYSFRFYSTEMVENNKIKLISIDGVYPSIENIENGTYPLASYFYAVTRSDAEGNTIKLLEWICGEQGQKIIEQTGYTPLK